MNKTHTYLFVNSTTKDMIIVHAETYSEANMEFEKCRKSRFEYVINTWDEVGSIGGGTILKSAAYIHSTGNIYR